jgi:hypothetical protein
MNFTKKKNILKRKKRIKNVKYSKNTTYKQAVFLLDNSANMNVLFSTQPVKQLQKIEKKKKRCLNCRDKHA